MNPLTADLTTKPRRKLIACVSTVQFRKMVADGELRSPGWTASYRKPGNTIPIVHRSASLALFGRGDAIYLCAEPESQRRQYRASANNIDEALDAAIFQHLTRRNPPPSPPEDTP